MHGAQVRIVAVLAGEGLGAEAALEAGGGGVRGGGGAGLAALGLRLVGPLGRGHGAGGLIGTAEKVQEDN